MAEGIGNGSRIKHRGMSRAYKVFFGCYVSHSRIFLATGQSVPDPLILILFACPLPGGVVCLWFHSSFPLVCE